MKVSSRGFQAEAPEVEASEVEEPGVEERKSGCRWVERPDAEAWEGFEGR